MISKNTQSGSVVGKKKKKDYFVYSLALMADGNARSEKRRFCSQNCRRRGVSPGERNEAHGLVTEEIQVLRGWWF